MLCLIQQQHGPPIDNFQIHREYIEYLHLSCRRALRHEIPIHWNTLHQLILHVVRDFEAEKVRQYHCVCVPVFQQRACVEVD